MAEPQDLPPPPAPPARRSNLLLWFVLIASWVALGSWAWHVYRQAASAWPLIPNVPAGTYHTVKAAAGPISLRLDDGTLVRLGGLAEPQTPAEADRARARLAELAPPDATVFVELEPRRAGDDQPPAPASVFLPPEGAGRPWPFPYARSRLLGQILVSEGLVRVTPEEGYRYHNEFLMTEDDARRHHRGVWGGTVSERPRWGTATQHGGTCLAPCQIAGWHGHALLRGRAWSRGGASTVTQQRVAVPPSGPASPRFRVFFAPRLPGPL